MIRDADVLEHVGDLDDPRVQLTSSSDVDKKHHPARDKHHVLYELVHSAGGDGVSSGELHRRYDEASERVYDDVAQILISRRSRRTKLQKLQDYDLIRCDGSGSRRQYRAIDESVRSDVVDGQLLVV